VKSLDEHLDAVVRAGVPGAVALAAAPSLSWEKSAGIADVKTGARLTPDHRFRIASVTKLFVATVVLQLVDEGALALDGEVGSIARGVTVRQPPQPHQRASELRRARFNPRAVSEEQGSPLGVDTS
jgi:D-alanyl-D-alanine carboxypeptidase